MAEINKLKRGQIPAWLFQSVKESFLQKLKVISEDPGSKIDFATESYLYNIPMSEYFNMEEKIKAITIDDIKATANKYFAGNYLTISFSDGDP